MKLAKFLCVICLAAFLVGICWTDNYADKPVAEIEQVMLHNEKVFELTKGTANDLRRYYGLNEEDYDGCILYRSISPMDVDELLIVKMKDSSQKETLETAVENRLETQKKSFEGYGVEQTALLSDAVFEFKGDYAFFGVSGSVQDWEKEFLSSIQN
ncbi:MULTISPECIES: DUF4358 domain-containing protein [Clostridiaceae]|uniref:DUF4358 domain-containing protein n=1 Tax=Clostridium facile TaxID=2763035 RepID=A0ABR7IP04_9CLOT|nr:MULTISPECIES: DUF4358 domain-containing protein [Clostridiaceae]MBC5786842.1 DUF4358 domain-containing protein [Clostridium facile]